MPSQIPLVPTDPPPGSDGLPRHGHSQLRPPASAPYGRCVRFQIVVNSADPHSLCRFWANLLGYQIDDDPDRVRRMIEAGAATWADVAEVDGTLTWRAAAACVDPAGHGPRLLFQVPDGLPPKVDLNRVHLDLNPPRHEALEVVDRAVQLGATRMWEGGEGPARWVTLTDPEGNEFCVTL